MSLDQLTFGSELEWSDVDKRVEIPEELGEWDTEDVNVVNSDGTAADPKGITTPYGGEICTTPVSSIDEFESQVSQLVDLLKPGPTMYSNHIHTHITYPGLVDDLEAMKKLFEYSLTVIPFALSEWAKIPRVNDYEDLTPKERKTARWWSQQLSAWFGRVPPWSRHDEIRASTTPEEFHMAHFPISSRTGRRLLSMSPRSGMNVRSLFKHGTVEFRFFMSSNDPKQIRDMMELSKRIFEEGLTTQKPIEEIWQEKEWDIPHFKKIDFEKHDIYLQTKRSK